MGRVNPSPACFLENLTGATLFLMFRLCSCCRGRRAGVTTASEWATKDWPDFGFVGISRRFSPVR